MRAVVGIAVLVVLAVPGMTEAQVTGALLAGPVGLDKGVKPAVGIVFGYMPAVIGFEVEYLGTLGERVPGRSSAGGIALNLIVPAAKVGEIQGFVVGGVALWAESFGDGEGAGEVSAKDVGGGLRLWMTGHLALRLDYRLFFVAGTESSGAHIRHPQWFAAGLHVVL